MCKYCKAFKAEELEESGTPVACAVGFAKLKIRGGASKSSRQSRRVRVIAAEFESQQGTSDEGVGSEVVASESALTSQKANSSGDCPCSGEQTARKQIGRGKRRESETCGHHEGKPETRQKQRQSQPLQQQKRGRRKTLGVIDHSTSSASSEPGQAKQQQLPGTCKGDDDSQWSNGEAAPLSLSLEDSSEIIDLDGLLELPSEEIDFPPPRQDGETDEDPNARDDESKGGAVGCGDGDAANAAAEAVRCDKDGAGDRHRKKSLNKKKQHLAADTEKQAEAGEDNATSESIYDCQPDKENEFFSLPDI